MKVVISGASSGVGYALANRLHLNLDEVVGIGRREKIELPIEYHSLDYCDGYAFDQIDPAGLDAIVHCSAQFKMATLNDTSEEEIHDMISTNLTSAIKFVKHFQPHLVEGGHIVLVSSVSGLRGQRYQTVYSATKHGLQGFADSLRQEVHQKVTTICPGGINTPLWNEKNPYPGEVNDLLTPAQVANVIFNVLDSEDMVFKNITLYPENESH